MTDAPVRSRFAQLRARLGVEAALVGVGMLISMSGQMLVVRIVSGHLDRASYGRYSLTNSAIALFQSVLVGSIITAMTRLVPEARKTGSLARLRDAVGGLVYPLILGAIPIVLALSAFFAARGDRAAAVLAPVAVLAAYASFRTSRTQNLEQMARRRGMLAAHYALDFALQTALLAGALSIFAHPAVALACVASGTAIANRTLEGRVTRVLAASDPKAETDDAPADYRSKLLGLAVPFSGAVVTTWLLTNADRWFVQHYVGLEEAGLYAAAAQLGAAPFGVLAGLVNNTAGPILFGRADDDPGATRKWVWRIAASYAAVAGVGWIALTLLRDVLVHVLVGRAFWDCADLVPIIAAGWCLLHVATTFSIGIVATGDTRKLLGPNLFGALVGLAANAWLVPRHGARGAAFALVATGAARLVAIATAYAWLAPGRGVDARHDGGSP